MHIPFCICVLQRNRRTRKKQNKKKIRFQWFNWFLSRVDEFQRKKYRNWPKRKNTIRIDELISSECAWNVIFFECVTLTVCRRKFEQKSHKKKIKIRSWFFDNTRKQNESKRDSWCLLELLCQCQLWFFLINRLCDRIYSTGAHTHTREQTPVNRNPFACDTVCVQSTRNKERKLDKDSQRRKRTETERDRGHARAKEIEGEEKDHRIILASSSIVVACGVAHVRDCHTTIVPYQLESTGCTDPVSHTHACIFHIFLPTTRLPMVTKCLNYDYFYETTSASWHNKVRSEREDTHEKDLNLKIFPAKEVKRSFLLKKSSTNHIISNSIIVISHYRHRRSNNIFYFVFFSVHW